MVDPVLCLAGERSAAFGTPVVVRGVFVVPVEQLCAVDAQSLGGGVEVEAVARFVLHLGDEDRLAPQ